MQFIHISEWVVSGVIRKIDSGLWQKSIAGGRLAAPCLLHKRAGRKESRAAQPLVLPLTLCEMGGVETAR